MRRALRRGRISEDIVREVVCKLGDEERPACHAPPPMVDDGPPSAVQNYNGYTTKQPSAAAQDSSQHKTARARASTPPTQPLASPAAASQPVTRFASVTRGTS